MGKLNVYVLGVSCLRGKANFDFMYKFRMEKIFKMELTIIFCLLMYNRVSEASESRFVMRILHYIGILYSIYTVKCGRTSSV